MQQRLTSFSSGSRQAPDPYDQFLEQQGFYRKHTARDASSLFRVISEQIYDTQMHHLAIRKKCVNYMRKHRTFFQILIDRDLDEYLDEMSKPKTFATLIELQAVGLLYERNVLLFEPFNLGNIFGYFRPYFPEVFRVFCTPEKHFDSVYTSLFIKDAAICQSLVYELLYKDLFKLPDVQYAVEIMLHNGNLEPQEYHAETNDEGYQTRIELVDQRSFPLDFPQHTKCILEDSNLCRFHNSVIVEEDSVEKAADQKSLTKQNTETLLTDKYISCVRQLLMEGITPFPYKVAKALDPTMYRNIEFDSWNEARKEQKLQNWYCGDGNFKVGAKCHVKLGKNDELYTGHIQDISTDRTHCLVFIEQLGEKRLVSYDALSPLPVEDFKPWALPYRFHRQLQRYNSMRLSSRQYNCHFKAQQATVQNYCKTFRAAGMTKAGQHSFAGTTFSMDYSDIKQQHHYIAAAASAGQQRFHKSCIYNLTHLENFHARTLEYVTMPLTVEHSVNLKLNENDVAMHGGEDAANRTATTAAVADSAAAAEEAASEDANNGVADTSPGSREVALINQNYILEQAAPGEYVPEYTTFYSMPACVGASEDFYSYGCEPAMAAQQFGHNGMYYMCNPAAAGGGPSAAIHAYSSMPNNFYGPALQTPQSVIISPTPMTAAPPPQYICTAANPYYASPVPTSAVMPTLLTQATSLSHTIQENGNNSAVGIATPLSGRINYEAKKSFKSNGMDLPSDIPTLRFFYNLGIDSHNRRRYSHESSISGREAIAVKEERTAEAKDSNNNSSKTDDNNNIPSIMNSKSNNSNANSSHGGNNNKSQFGPPRRFQMRYNNNNNNSRDYRQPQRRNSSNDDSVNAGSYSNSQNSYGHRNNYNNNKHQNQHSNTGGGAGDRHADTNRPNSTPSISHNTGGGGNNIHRMQYSRNYNRNSYYENSGQHGGASSAGGDGAYEAARDNNNGNEHTESGQMYSPYGQPPSSQQQQQQHFDISNDYNTITPNALGPAAMNGAGTASGNLLIPLHVHQPHGGGAPHFSTTTLYTTAAPASASLIQPTTQANTFGSSPTYAAAPPPPSAVAPTTYFGHPPPSPLMQHHGAFNAQTVSYGGGLIGPAGGGFYTPSNPLSSNASESSGNGGGGGIANGECNLSQPPPVGPYGGAGGGGSIPIYVSQSGANGGAVTNPAGQPMLHHASIPQSHINGGPQAFWCVPPPPAAVGPTLMQPPAPPHIPPPPLNNVNYVGPTSTANNNGVIQNRKSQQHQTEKETTQQ